MKINARCSSKERGTVGITCCRILFLPILIFSFPGISGNRLSLSLPISQGLISIRSYFLPGEEIFPVACEVAADPLQHLTFNNYKELSEVVHQEPRDYMNDFCADKREVTFKLRTGDICEDCRKISRINRIIVKWPGEDLARFYKIEGPKGEPRKILLDRSMVTWDIEDEDF